MASSSSARFPKSGQQNVSVLMVLLIALHAMAHLNDVAASPPMVINGSLNGTSAENLHLVQALKDKGGFTAAATLLGAVDLNSLLPGSSTILVPMDDGVTRSGLQFSTFNTALPILQYHVITRRLAFSDLQQLPEGEMLQTLLPNNTIMITSNSSANFTLDDVPLSHKNLFLAGSTAVHGISGILNFATYGKMTHLHDFQIAAPPATSPVDGVEPAHQQLAPPNSASNNSRTNNETRSSPLPAAATGISANSSISNSPPSAPASQTENASSSAPSLSFPIPSPVPPKPDLNIPDSTQAHAPASSQQDSPSSPFDCNDQLFSLLCSSPSSSHDQLKPWPLVLLLTGLFLLAKISAMSRFTFICLVLVIMAATPASGEKDVSEMLRSRGGFDYAATYLEAIDMNRVLPNRSTVLVPTDAALQATGLIYNTLGAALPTLKYHVVTRQLSFKDLHMLPVGATLATLLPNSSLLVTNNAASNFTINDVLLSHPDIFCFNGTAIHGIAGVMNVSRVYSSSPAEAYNTGLPGLTPPDLPPQLILPLPEFGAPFAAPIPVSQASMQHVRGLNLSHVALSCMQLLATSCFLLTFTGHFISKPCRR